MDRPPKISVVIIEDHQTLADALRALVDMTPDLVVAGTAGTCAAGLELVARAQPEVVVLDVALPDGDGIDLVPEVRRRQPHASVLILTSLTDTAVLRRAIDTGVNGFIPKQRPANELLAAIRHAAAGEMVIAPSLVLSLLHGSATNQPAPTATLTAREHEVLVCLVQGKSGPQIAAALNIALPTVRTHIGNLMSKLSVHSRLEAVAVALRAGLVEKPF